MLFLTTCHVKCEGMIQFAVSHFTMTMGLKLAAVFTTINDTFHLFGKTFFKCIALKLAENK